MTKEEYEKLRTGDLVESPSGSRYVIVERRSTEPITQIAKDDISSRLDQFKVIMKVQNNE